MRGIPRRSCAEIPATKISSRNFGNASGGVEEGKAAARAPIRSRPNAIHAISQLFAGVSRPVQQGIERHAQLGALSK